MPQRAIGPYNVDFTLVPAPVAVDIVTYRGNARAAARRRQRIEYLLSAGWHLVEVIHRRDRTVYPFAEPLVSYLAAVSAAVLAQPTTKPRHQLIRADGEPVRPKVHSGG